MFQKFLKQLKDFIKEDCVFLIILLVLFIICNIPMNYYITVGGGVSDVSSRIQVDNAYKSKGSFNISYVSQLDANLFVYLLSYIIPGWEREDANLYKYDINESFEDIQFRSDIDLKDANSTATYWAYTLAEKEVKLLYHKIFVIAVYPEEFPTKLKVQDELVSIDGNAYSSILDFRDYIQSKEVGDKVIVKVIRNGKEKEIESQVYQDEDIKIIGVSLHGVSEFETDPKINIKFRESESGPSGGLISSLEIYNQLTKKDLTNGLTIAGTGTIEEDGSIGQIGGITHKILGASKAGADVFLCPGGENYKEAKKYIKDKKLKIKLIKVNTLEDAIQKLEALK